MRLEKHLESLKEVLDEIEAGLKDSRGLCSHQRRIAMMLSIGICDLVEVYLHKLNIMKGGARIKHTWFRQNRIKEKLEQQIICSIDSVKNINEILILASSIEESRDDLAYGAPVEEGNLLMEKIISFLI